MPTPIEIEAIFILKPYSLKKFVIAATPLNHIQNRLTHGGYINGNLLSSKYENIIKATLSVILVWRDEFISIIHKKPRKYFLAYFLYIAQKKILENLLII